MTRLLVRDADPRVAQQLVTDGVLPALARVLAGLPVQAGTMALVRQYLGQRPGLESIRERLAGRATST